MGSSMEYEKLAQLLSEILEVEPDRIKPDKSFVKDFGADSLIYFQILMGVEATFGILVDEEEAAHWKTVGQLWEYLQTGRTQT
jgi:acyl carrier protein